MKKRQFIAIAVILFITAIVIGVEQHLYTDSVQQTINVTASRPGEIVFYISDPNGDSSPLKNYKQTRPVKVGETFRVLGHDVSKLWVETENGERGLIDQLLVADTVITTDATKEYPKGRKMIIESVDSETQCMSLRDQYGDKYQISRSGDVQMMYIFRNPRLQVRKMGYGWVRSSIFDNKVVGASLADLDTTFAPVLYRYADRAVLSIRVYDPEERAFFLPILQVSSEGFVTNVVTYSRPFNEFSRIRSWLLSLPGATLLLDYGQSYTDAGGGLYDQDETCSDVHRRMRWHRNPEIPQRTGMGKFWGFIGRCFRGLFLGLFALSLVCWYYGVSIFIIPVIMIQLARSPQPFKRLSNEQLRKVFEWLSYPFFYIALLVSAADMSNNLLFNMLIIFGTYYAIFGVMSALISERCPNCKHTFCFDLDKTKWGESEFTVERETESYEAGEDYTGSTKNYTEVSVDGRPVVNTNVTITDHYDVTTRHDTYDVTYEHKKGIEYYHCRHCGHCKTRDVRKRRVYNREFVGSHDTHHNRSYERDVRDEMR